MFNLEMLDVGIGLALFLMLVSLLASAIREFIEGFMKSRAGDLENGLRELLDDPNGLSTVKAFYDHSLINSLFAGSYKPEALQTNAKGVTQMPRSERKNLPSYIPAGQFATAIIDLVARGTGSAYPVASGPITLDDLRQRAALLSNPRLQRAVLSAIDHAGNDLSAAKKNLEAWFNGTMDRVSGVYKRRTQLWLFGIGIVLAVTFNLDAITIGKRLLNDPVLRQAVVVQAEKQAAPAPEADKVEFNAVKDRLGDIGFPFGWDPMPQRQCDQNKNCKIPSLSVGAWVMIFLGWVATGLATTFGAPFWFDMLNKMMVIRSTVKPREKSQEEGSEDRAATPAPAAPPAASVVTTQTAGTPQTQAAPPSPPPPQPGDGQQSWAPGFTNQHGDAL